MANPFLKQKTEINDAFLRVLVNHIEVVGGYVPKETLENMPFREVLDILTSNGIILGFRNYSLIKRKREIFPYIVEEETFEDL